MPGECNPADIISRGCTVAKLKSNTWFKGPTWMKLSMKEWPIEFPDIAATPEGALEIRGSDNRKFQDCVSLVVTALDISAILSFSKYSSSRKLFRVTAWVRRFIENIKNLREGRALRVGDLCVEEVEGAERSWLLSVQRGMETDGSLKHLETHLNLFQDEFGVLRCRSRLENSDLVETQKFPVILPRKNNLTELIIMDAHRRALHMGSNSTIALVRTKFWVPKLRQLVRQLLRNCIVCRKLNGKAYPSQPAPPLPKFRVVFEEPFSSTGLDFAGPLYIKTKCAQNPSSKVYFLLLTCSASRAIHLELVPDMTSSSCVRALRRFIARRGVPNLIFSDNAKTFKAAETKAFALDRGIKWRYNLTEAPWTGGVFERMIGVTKRSLRKVLGRACVTYEELETILVEVESIINDRPISYIDTSDTSEALTPNHLLYGRRLAALVDEASKCSDDVGGSCNLSRRYLYRLRLIEQAKRKWKSEYLLELRLWVKRARLVSSSIKVGDIVLVEDRVPRTMWPLARVESLIISGDGLVRGLGFAWDLNRVQVIRSLH